VGVLPQPFQYLAGMAKVRKVTVRTLRGKVRFSLDLAELREDRSFS